ncbi:hypothetical protein GOP47_0009932 [Adiantum capillus-veneris]|uniref:Protein kinase domain-containing protein n=1 Tax=Adiantum capillus-veneris TaxID=13818 RepID=A0A9D4UXI5_ADICA|nr:hypothetical protein GOP47_0009932 [Adiantum capillus-veneris]
MSSAFQVSDHSKLGGAFSSKTLKPSSVGVFNSTYKVHKPHLETHLASSSGAANAIHHGSLSFGSFSRVVFFNGSHQSLQYDLEELEVATNFFSVKNLLGKRAGHSVVYKRVLRDGSSVAIKALHKASYKTGMSQFKVSRPVQWKTQKSSFQYSMGGRFLVSKLSCCSITIKVLLVDERSQEMQTHNNFSPFSLLVNWFLLQSSSFLLQFLTLSSEFFFPFN